MRHIISVKRAIIVEFSLLVRRQELRINQKNRGHQKNLITEADWAKIKAQEVD